MRFWANFSVRKNENAAWRVSTDDHVSRGVRFHDRADGRELIAAKVKAVARLCVEDVDFSRLRHRTHDEHVLAWRMPLGLNLTKKSLKFSQKLLNKSFISSLPRRIPIRVYLWANNLILRQVMYGRFGKKLLWSFLSCAKGILSKQWFNNHLERGQPPSGLVVVMKLSSRGHVSGLSDVVENADLVVVADGDDRPTGDRREEGGRDGLGVADQWRHRSEWL